MFSELEVFADVHIPSHIDENSNEENDVDDETMSGKFQLSLLIARHFLDKKFRRVINTAPHTRP